MTYPLSIFVIADDNGTTIRVCPRDAADMHYHLARTLGAGPVGGRLRIGIGTPDAIPGVKATWPTPVTVVYEQIKVKENLTIAAESDLHPSPETG